MNTRRAFLKSVVGFLGLSGSYLTDRRIGRSEYVGQGDKLRDGLREEGNDFVVDVWARFEVPNQEYRNSPLTTVRIDRDRYAEEVGFDYEFHEQIVRVQEDAYVSEILDQMEENMTLDGIMTRKNIKYSYGSSRINVENLGEPKTDEEIRETKDKIFEDWLPYYVKAVAQWHNDYELDGSSTGEIGYCRHPLESIVDASGDCKDSTILMFSLLSNSGFDVGYTMLPGHVGLLINKKHIGFEDVETWYENGDDEYTFVEPNSRQDFGKHIEFTSEDIIVNWTKKYGFDGLDSGNIPDYISSGSRVLKDSLLKSM